MNIKPGAPFSAEEFKRPSNDCAVTYMWFWNEPVTKERIDEELIEYRRAGVESLYVVPLPKDFRPETLRTFLSPEYLTDEFFELVSYAVRRAIELGMRPWLYDEGGWPSGGACYRTFQDNPGAKPRKIEAREVQLDCDERFVPGEGFIALFDGKRRLPDNYIACRDVRLTAYYEIRVMADGNRVDYTNAAVTDSFIKNTYEGYKAHLGELFGEALPIIFTDEPALGGSAIAENELELFIREYGYDLRDYIYVLMDFGREAKSEAEIKARIDHYMLFGRLFRENTCKRLYDWCEKNGIYYAGHLDKDNNPRGGMSCGTFSALDALRKMHVPGVDAIWEQIRYPYDGREPLDDETLGMGFFPRFAASAARQCGRNVAVTESLGIYGDGLTPDEIRYVINYQIIRGINAINFAPISFGKSRLSALMTRPNFRPEKPGFYNLKHIHEYFARLSYLARLGHAEGDTALYIPCRDFCAGPVRLDEAGDAFRDAGTALEEKSIPFDVIDEYGVRDATEVNGGLMLGDAIYRHVVVPECRYMPEDVRKKIAPYLGEGEPIMRPKSNKLRFMTRKLDTGRLLFIFNEGYDTVTEAFSDVSNAYRLDASSGEIYRYRGEPLTLPCGEIAVLYITDDEISTVSCTVESSTEITGFVPVSHKRFCIGYHGIYNELGEGLPRLDLPFSGEITYAAEYELPSEPRVGERYRIVLDGFSVSAEVRIGRAQIALGITPMVGIVDGGQLDRVGKIEITVANTAADEVIAKDDVIMSYPTAEIGIGYRPRLEKFEKRRPVLRFGRVRIEKAEDKGDC